MSMEQRAVDVAIIGAGTAGMTAYRAVKKAGLSVALIEDSHYGTTCARVGCMPSKLLIAAADAAQAVREASAFGVNAEAPSIDGKKVMQRVRDERDRFVNFVLDDIQSFADEDKIWGKARFLSDTLLQIDDKLQLSASRTIIATGSVPVIPGVFRALGDRMVVNDDVFDWHDLPEKVAVIGTGVIALELGQALARLGVDTRVIGRADDVAGIQDPKVLASARAIFEKDFDLLLCTDVREVHRDGDKAVVTYQPRNAEPITETFDYVLLATGRRPNVDHLGLENTSAGAYDGIRFTHFNRETLQLGSSPVFLAGDVNAQWPLLHEAADDGYLAGANAARYPEVQEGSRRAPLGIVFTDPQVARVGPGYRHLPEGVVIGQVDFSRQGRARIMLKNAGLLRVYAQAGSGLFLGAEMAGPQAEHIAHLLAWAYQQKLTVSQMLSMPFYHPVLEEGLRTALRDAQRKIN